MFIFEFGLSTVIVCHPGCVYGIPMYSLYFFLANKEIVAEKKTARRFKILLRPNNTNWIELMKGNEEKIYVKKKAQENT